MPIRAIVLYEREPDPERYRQHVEQYASAVPGATFRHGPIRRTLVGEQQFAYYAEFEWSDRAEFQEGARSPEFTALGEDAMEMGIPFTVHVANIE